MNEPRKNYFFIKSKVILVISLMIGAVMTDGSYDAAVGPALVLWVIGIILMYKYWRV